MKIEINNLIKKYGDEVVLNDISLQLEGVEAVAILGISGSGKSTLLRLMSGIETFDSGSISVDDHDIYSRDYKDKIGFVFQSDSLFPHLTVLDNIVLILDKIKGIDKTIAEEKTIDLLKQFGLEEHIDKYPHQLSGGQTQRVSIVRSLAVDASLFFFDEPTSALDPILTVEVLETIMKLRSLRKNFLIVTHEVGFARNAADYIIFIDEGKIVEHGPVSILDEPKSKEFKNFLSKIFTW